MDRQEALKFATTRGRQLWLISAAAIEPATIHEGARNLVISPNSQRLALRCLADFQRDNAAAWPSQAKIRAWLGDWSASKLNRVLKALKSAGLLAIQNIWNPTTQRKTARYCIAWATLSELAAESVETVSESAHDFPIEADHFPIEADHFPTMGNRIYHIEPSINNRIRAGARETDDRPAAGLARELSQILRPAGNRDHYQLRALCRRYLAGDIPKAAWTDALAAVSDNRPRRPMAYFSTILANNWGITLDNRRP